MKKIIILVCLIICAMFLCSSCAKTMDAKEFYKDYEFKIAPTLNNGQELVDLSKLSFEDSSLGKILVFKSTTASKKTNFYNAETNRIIYEISSINLLDYDVITVFDQTLLIVIEAQTTSNGLPNAISILDSDGNIIATKKTGSYDIDKSEFTSTSDLFEFDGKIYRVNNSGEATLIIDNPFFGTLPSGLVKTNRYYYQVFDDEVTVFDHSLKQVLYWELPYDGCDMCNISILSDEKLLVQVVNVLPDSEKTYSILDEDGVKYSITSLIIDVENGEEKKVNLDYFVVDIFYSSNYVLSEKSSENLQIPDEIDNMAIIYYIKDHRLNQRDYELVSLNSKNASVDCEVAPEFDNLPTIVAPGRYIYTSKSQNAYLLDDNFNIISNADNYSQAKKNIYYIVLNNRVYDYDFNLVYDLDENGKEFVSFIGDSFIIADVDEDYTEYYMYSKDGTLTRIDDYYSSNDRYYVTRESNKNGTYNFSIYNQKGTNLLSIKSATGNNIYVIYQDEEVGYIISATLTSGTHYYKLSK